MTQTNLPGSRPDFFRNAAAFSSWRRSKLKTVLQPTQQQRIAQIELHRLGTASLLHDDVSARLKYSDSQRQKIKELIDKTQTEVTAIEKEVSAGKPREPLEKKFSELKTEELKQLQSLLQAEQRTAWNEVLGASFDLSKLGLPAFKAPEIISVN